MFLFASTRAGASRRARGNFHMSFPKSCPFWLAVFLIGSTQSALPQRCPPNSHPAAIAIPGNLRTAQCFCNPGYENVGGACVRIATDRTRAQSERSRAECIGVAGKKLKADLAKCRAPMVECLKNAGASLSAAACTASALVIAPDASKANVPRAALACGDKAYPSNDVCGFAWEQCRSIPLTTYRNAIAACRSD